MGWVPCPPSFLAQSHIARLLRDHVAKAGPLAVQLTYGPRCVRRYEDSRSPHGFGGGACYLCYLLPVWHWTDRTSLLLGTVLFFEGRGSRDCEAWLVADCWFHGEQVLSADRWIWGCVDVGCTRAGAHSSGQRPLWQVFPLHICSTSKHQQAPSAPSQHAPRSTAQQQVRGRTAAGSLGGRRSR